jgi:protein phosphatase 1L
LAVSRAFGDRNLKALLRSEPDIKVENIDHTAELLVLASDGLWKVWFFSPSKFVQMANI